MIANKRLSDSIPESFNSIDEAAEFWDQHDLSDYWDTTTEVEIRVNAPHRLWIPVASHLATATTARARREGISLETLVNLWIAERLSIDSLADH